MSVDMAARQLSSVFIKYATTMHVFNRHPEFRQTEYVHMYIVREVVTGGSTAHTAAADTAVDNLQLGLVSYGRRDCSWWRVSWNPFSEAPFG